MIIDNIGFDVVSVKAMTEKQFMDQYREQKQTTMTEQAWEKWMKDAYAKLTAKKQP